MTLRAIEKSKGEESFMIENVGIVYFVSLTFYFGKHDDGRNWWRVVEGGGRRTTGNTMRIRRCLLC